MDGRRSALIVASDEFEHPGLSRLQAPLADAEALADVLGDPAIGAFHVEVVHNAPSHAVQARVEDLFAEGRPDDLLLLHFSGHGLKSDSGELFLAATNTRPDRLASTAVSADFVQRCMRGSRARSIVLFLDCCYGGAFGEGVAVRAAGPANVLDSFPAGKLGGGRGRAVISASSAMEYAFEGSALATDHQVQASVFTSALVQGLRTGAADRDEDGLVSLNELYDYVFDQVRTQNPHQTPSRDIELQGELYVARSQRKRVRAVPLPADLRAAVQDANMYTRLGAVGELRARLASADPGVALGAREALEYVARSDTSYVADAARDALASSPPPGPTESAPPGTGPVTSDPTEPGPGYGAPAPDTAPPQPGAPSQAPPAALPVVTTVASTAPASAPTGTPASAPTQTSSSAAAVPLTASADSGNGTAAPGHSPADRARVVAGRTLLVGALLMTLSTLLPHFVDDQSVGTVDPALAVGLFLGGIAAAALAAATLFLPALRTRWRWPLLTLAAAATVPLVALGATLADRDASNVDVGIWVAGYGCATCISAGVVCLTRWRAGTGTTAPAAPLSPLARLVGRGAVVSSATIITATFAVRFVGDLQAMVEPNLVWAWLFPGAVGLTAGIVTLHRRPGPGVGVPLAAGAGAAALWGVWDLPRIWADVGTSELNSGFFLELGGLLGLVATGGCALAVLRREHGLTTVRPRWQHLLVVSAVAVLTAIPFVRVARANLASSETGNAAHDIAMVVLVLLVPVLCTVVRPPDLGALVLVGWSLAASGIVVAYWRLLRHDGSPLLGVPYALATLAALASAAVVAATIGGGRTVRAAGD